jgi:Zn-dependent protease
MTMPSLPRRASVRPSPVFLAVVAVTAASGGYLWQVSVVSKLDRAISFVFVIAAWILTLCLHEFAHAFLAWRFGDREVEARGYLTLNPLKYSHPVLSILLPVLFIALGGFGLPGGAVYLHTHLFRSPLRRALVSLSGPAVNLMAAVALLVAFKSTASQSHSLFWYAVAFLAFLQVTATVLNLLPVPGLDGYGAIEPYLKPETQRGFAQFKPWGMLAVFALLSVRQINTFFFDVVYRIYEVSGVSRFYAAYGDSVVRFWQH